MITSSENIVSNNIYNNELSSSNQKLKIELENTNVESSDKTKGNNDLQIDIRKSLKNPENRISDNIKEVFNEIINGREKSSGSYHDLEEFKKYTEQFSYQKKDEETKVNDIRVINQFYDLNLTDDTDKVITVGATFEEMLEREESINDKTTKEKEIVRQIKKQFIDDITPNVENYLKEIEEKSLNIMEDFDKLYKNSEKLGIDFEKESKNFTKDSLKNISGDLIKSQKVEQADIIFV